MPVDEIHLTHAPSVRVGMGIRRPPADVFKAFVDPTATTRFWFSRSSGKLVTGATVQWDFEVYGVSVEVEVKHVETDRRIVFEWSGGGEATRVEFRFLPWGDGATYVEITEDGFMGTGDEMVARVADSTEGFTTVLCTVKAMLEHDVILSTVADSHPKDLVM